MLRSASFYHSKNDGIKVRYTEMGYRQRHKRIKVKSLHPGTFFSCPKNVMKKHKWSSHSNEQTNRSFFGKGNHIKWVLIVWNIFYTPKSYITLCNLEFGSTREWHMPWQMHLGLFMMIIAYDVLNVTIYNVSRQVGPSLGGSAAWTYRVQCQGKDLYFFWLWCIVSFAQFSFEVKDLQTRIEMYANLCHTFIWTSKIITLYVLFICCDVPMCANLGYGLTSKVL